ncbi:MAG: DMT family transporter [Ilumatobacteraceae bacterium]
MEQQRLPIVASLMALGSGIIWSLGTVTARKASHIDTFQYLIWRSIGIIIVIETIAAFKGTGGKTLRAWRSGRAMRGANVGLFLASICFVFAVKTTTPANAAFLSSLTPLVAVLFARFLGERLNRSTIVALAVGVVGLIVTVYGDLEAGNMVGNVSALLSSVGFALYTTCVRTDPHRDWSLVLPGYGAMMIAVCSAVTLINGKRLIPPAADMGYALFHGAVIIVVGTLMFNEATKHVPAVPMTVFAQTEMAFVPIWGILLLDLHPKALTLLGGAIIFAAVVGKALYDTMRGRKNEYPAAPDVPLL